MSWTMTSKMTILFDFEVAMNTLVFVTGGWLDHWIGNMNPVHVFRYDSTFGDNEVTEKTEPNCFLVYGLLVSADPEF